MKQFFAALLALLLAWPAAGQKSPAPTAEPSAILTAEETLSLLATTILDSQSDGEAYRLLSPEDTEFYLTELYHIPPDRPDRAALIYAVGGVDAREIALIHTANTGLEEKPAAGLEAYRQNRYNDFAGYVPQEAERAEKGLVLENGNWSVLLLCSQPDRALAALDRDYPDLALGLYDPGEVVYDWTDYVDEKGWRLFEAPGLVDMTLYDTSAICRAYATGNEQGLSEKDAAILAKCREILSACVTDTMTDFEKELALHDWLVDHCGYDLTSRSSPSAQGRPDNQNPYGLLVEGCGICLGYATSFQLLMDLAGVECITVVGASSGSSRDHAWNMVKLEGEWYCVDVTWDDPVFSVSPTFYPAQWLAERHHKYFNVTSDFMRQTDHQWDYTNTPEATAARFRWDGVGEKPK